MHADTDDTLKLYGHGNTSFAIPFNFKLQRETSQNTRASELRNLIEDYMATLTTDETPNWVVSRIIGYIFLGFFHFIVTYFK
jgi:hypothetical protein